jgi:hypothetical protein
LNPGAREFTPGRSMAAKSSPAKRNWAEDVESNKSPSTIVADATSRPPSPQPPPPQSSPPAVAATTSPHAAQPASGGPDNRPSQQRVTSRGRGQRGKGFRGRYRGKGGRRNVSNSSQTQTPQQQTQQLLPSTPIRKGSNDKK